MTLDAAGIGAPAAVAGVLVALGALIVARNQLGEARHQRSQQMGLQYGARYWEISDGLLHSPKGSAEYRRHQHRYVLLCEDEFEAVNGGWLDSDMWEAWHSWLADQPGTFSRSETSRTVATPWPRSRISVTAWAPHAAILGPCALLTTRANRSANEPTGSERIR